MDTMLVTLEAEEVIIVAAQNALIADETYKREVVTLKVKVQD